MLNVTNPSVMKELLARHGFHFSKSKGQNFLTQRWVPQRIAQESGVDRNCGVVEIGPGFGPLTQELCLRAGKVLALEVDTTLKPVLVETVGEFENLEILFTDALKADLPRLVSEKLQGLKPMACANLPYYITSPVLTKLLESRCFSSITVMVQKEVAQRICAKAGSADYSAFTVFCNYYAVPKMLFDVPPSCFMPQPKVTSAVLSLQMRQEPVAEVLEEGLFFRVVRAAFAQRRKTLLNALSAGLGDIGKEALGRILSDCGISPSIRGEALDIPAFAAIANAIKQNQKR